MPYTDTSGPAFANAAVSNDDQKRALLAAIAQNGSAGAAALQQQAQQAQQAKAAAIQQIAGATKGNSASISSPGFAGQQQALGAQVGDLRAADIAQGQQAYNQNIGQISAANDSYMGKVGAAIPIVQSRTQAAVQQIIAQQREAEAQRQAALQQQQLQLQQQRESIAAAQQDREYQRANNASSTDIAKAQLGIQQAEAQRQQICFENPNDPRCGGTASDAQKAADLATRQDAILRQTTGKANTALRGLTSGNQSLGEAMAALSTLYANYGKKGNNDSLIETPGGHKLDRGYLEDYLRRFYTVV